MDSGFKILMNYLSRLEKLFHYFIKLFIKYFENIWIEIMLMIKASKCTTFWRKYREYRQVMFVLIPGRILYTILLSQGNL